MDATWVIPALPLFGFLVLVAFGRRMGEPLAGWFATLLVAGSFAASVVVWLDLRSADEHSFTQTLFTWLPTGGFSVDVGFLVDPLSISMCLFVTGISALIHLYSIGYMHGDEKFSKFFVYMNLFVFSMLMLVLGDNLLVTFLGWEGVGTCSYLLISFWHTKDPNATAGKKAFVTNRIGDWGFMVAIFLCFFALGSVQYTDIFAGAGGLATTTATAMAVLLFIGAVGKSAQLPLMVWLPDAMAGPTPVSALIHAATMVTAGVYLMTRMNPVLAVASPWVPTMIACIGVATALFAATIAVAQNDIKRVLAYSTISQLGYMFLAVGSGAYVAAIFHMITHAFFKALLFLGAGSVIHGMGGEQDMRRMGGLRKLLPITAFTFIIGWLAIAGVPPLSGFWSKDEILLSAWNKGGVTGSVLWAAGLVTALLTAFYMSRQVFLTFYGEPRWKHAPAEGGEAEQSASVVSDESRSEPGAAATAGPATAGPASTPTATLDDGHDGHDGHGEIHPHESPWTMTVPLMVLAVLALIGGALNLAVFARLKTLEHWLEPVVEAGEVHVTVGSGTKVVLALVATAAALLGILAAAVLYLRRRFEDRPADPEILARGWYYNDAVSAFMGGPGRKGFDGLAWFDRTVIDGTVNGIAALVRGGGDTIRRLQTGYVRNYALGVAFGAIALVGILVVRGVAL